MEYRLRIYTLRTEVAAEFVELWASDLVPLRRAMGFEVLSGWSIPDRSEFVWIVGWPGPGSYDEAEERYHRSPERVAVPWQTSDYVQAYDVRAIEPVQGLSLK